MLRTKDKVMADFPTPPGPTTTTCIFSPLPLPVIFVEALKEMCAVLKFEPSLYNLYELLSTSEKYFLKCK
jgi:hypothetical protein